MADDRRAIDHTVRSIVVVLHRAGHLGETTVVEDLLKTDLWREFAKKTSVVQRETVAGLLEYAIPILDRVRETFPTYTLHNSLHSLNVVKLMGNLLGNKIEQISALEGAMLILSAYFHDIGMVFSEEERSTLALDSNFEKFLAVHPAAFVEFNRSKVTEALAEWYCRWAHPQRVFMYLNDLDDKSIAWGVTSLRKALGDVCQSHGADAGKLVDDARFATNFLVNCDLAFCGILLRIADILDFDNSRSPEDVYASLGLSRRRTQRDAVSDVEWLKHLSSDGFRFPSDRPEGYALDFIAGPDDAAVEHDVLAFLTVIEGELNKCARVLRHCSAKWQSLALPREIDRSNVHSNGYRYGEYRFTLDQNKVLELFMGENLYDSADVFIRELVQNAIDTTRYRQYIESSNRELDRGPEAVRICSWIDRDGYRWVRVDDFGMGMTQEIVQKFLLRIGQSYYSSAEFEADAIRYAKPGDKHFVPISRFGIGILSCFIAGDLVEISTCPLIHSSSDSSPLRITLRGLHSFYTLRIPENKVAAFPSPYGDDESYRRNAGTSVAVRLDSQKMSADFDLESTLRRLIVASPVPIFLDGKVFDSGHQELVEEPWAEAIEFSPTSQELAEIRRNARDAELPEFKLRISPINLTKAGLANLLKGQGVTVTVVRTVELERWERKYLPAVPRRIALDWRRESDMWRLHIWVGTGGRNGNHLEQKLLELRRKMRIDPSVQKELEYLEWVQSIGHGRYVPVAVPGLMLPQVLTTQDPKSTYSNYASLLVVSHNGVAIPDAYIDKTGVRRQMRAGLGMDTSSFGALASGILLSDGLRPSLSVARSELRQSPWTFYSAIELAFTRALRLAGVNDPAQNRSISIFDAGFLDRDVILEQLMRDEHLRSEDGWITEPIVPTEQGRMSVVEMRGQILSRRKILLSQKTWNGLSGIKRTVILAMLQLNFDVIVQRIGSNTSFEISSNSSSALQRGLLTFPPMFFASYEGFGGLGYRYLPVNKRHPFSEWLIERTPEYQLRFPNIIQHIKRTLMEYQRGMNSALDGAVMSNRLNSAVHQMAQLDSAVAPQTVFLQPTDFQ